MPRRWISARPNRSISRSVTVLGITLFSSLAIAPSQLAAEAPPISIVRIEEDWEMKLLEPDPASSSPQVTFFTRPSENDPNRYFQTQMNYATAEAFSEGGFHVASVNDDSYYDEVRSSTRRGLTISNDTVVWTTVMAKQNDKLLFAIKNGHCTDWGNFGGPEFLVSMPAESIQDLNDYHPEQSIESVDIGFGANRVQFIMLKTIRVYYSNGVTSTFSMNQLYQQ